jgi:hypothetical protein
MPPPRRNSKIPNRPSPNDAMFVTWQDAGERKLALTTAAQASQEYGVIAQRERAYGSDIFMGAGGPGISTRDGMSRRDWEYFRPEDSIPREIRNIISTSMQAYNRIGIVGNTIDVMGEFTCQGIRLVHPNPRIQDLCQNWAKKINLYDRAERFCNYLYRMGNVIVMRETAIVKPTDIDNLRRGIAAEGSNDIVDRIDPPPKVRAGEVPWSYTYINPLSLELLGGDELAQFAGVAVYGLVIPQSVYNKIRNPKSPEERYIVEQLPQYVVTSARTGRKVIPLDPAKVQAFFYKKDDWQIWAKPITYRIIDDLVLYNKMRLADLSALDGAISHIRLWTLGSLEHQIMPTAAGMARLAEVLINNTATGAIDLIWGPELSFTETSTDVHRFLGSDKYGQTIQNIYDGLGVPYPSQGSGSGKGGMASQLSMRIMVERLKYGRGILNSFLEPELIWFQRALGLRQAPSIQYDYMVLDDENAWLRLLIELADRDLISVESLQEAFGKVPEIEQMLIRREHQKRDSGKLKRKVGPFHNPEVEDDLIKIFAQTGLVTPGEVGIELGDRAPGEKSMMELKLDQAKQAAKLKQQTSPFGGNGVPNSKPKGQPGQGRPKGKRDSLPRQKRTVKPVKAANFFATRAWAREVQGTIAEVVNPVYLSFCSKDTVRKLTDEEFKNLETFKFAVLCNLDPFTEFTEDKFKSMVENPLPTHPIVYELLNATLTKFAEKFARTPTIDETRLFQAEVYSLYAVADDEALNLEEEDNGED